jgi:outer membrane protein TolC
VPRGSTEPDANALPAVAPDALPPAGPVPRYRLLREPDAQCLAAQYAWLANLLDQERAALAAEHAPPKSGLCQLLPGQRHARESQLRQVILYYSALEDRNRAAGSALELFFKIAETEAQADLLDRTRADVQDALQRSEELLKKGFRLPVELSSLRRQLIDTDADRTRARAGLADLNGRLKGLTGLGGLPPDDWLWPAIEYPVSFEPVDVEAAVATALAKRPELLLLRVIDRELDAQTLAVIRDYLKSVSGLLGAHAAPATPLKHALAAVQEFLTARGGEKALRAGQLGQLLAERERAVADEVRRAAAALHTKARLVALSRERVLLAESRRRDAEARVNRGGGSFLEVLSTGLDWYKARAQLTTDVMGWHTARVQLKQAQGLLVWECCGDGGAAGK